MELAAGTPPVVVGTLGIEITGRDFSPKVSPPAQHGIQPDRMWHRRTHRTHISTPRASETPTAPSGEEWHGTNRVRDGFNLEF
jgi:hypothetical protein